MRMKFFEIAKKIKNHSDHSKHQLGAVITKGSKLISIGFNQKKTHPKSQHQFKNTHAEFHAIIKAKENLDDCEIYVYRETKDGTPAMARPCQSCIESLKQVGIQKVFYSGENCFIYEKIS